MLNREQEALVDLLVKLDPIEVGAFYRTDTVDDQHRFCLRRSVASVAAAAAAAAISSATSPMAGKAESPSLTNSTDRNHVHGPQCPVSTLDFDFQGTLSQPTVDSGAPLHGPTARPHSTSQAEHAPTRLACGSDNDAKIAITSRHSAAGYTQHGVPVAAAITHVQPARRPRPHSNRPWSEAHRGSQDSAAAQPASRLPFAPAARVASAGPAAIRARARAEIAGSTGGPPGVIGRKDCATEAAASARAAPGWRAEVGWSGRALRPGLEAHVRASSAPSGAGTGGLTARRLPPLGAAAECQGPRHRAPRA